MARTSSRSAAKKPWTFLVYLAGDNNLESAGVDDLGEMKKVGSTDAVNVVAQFDRTGTRGSTRYFLRKKTALAADAVQKLPVENTGDPSVLIDFLKWAVERYPADRYALVLWNHGQGWDDTDIFAPDRAGRRAIRRPPHVRRALFRTSIAKAADLVRRPGHAARAILIDDGAKDFLDNLELKKVLVAARGLVGHKLDLLGMDACLMSMPEVGFQARTAVSYTVGSEETEPGEGWPYDRILRALAGQPTMAGDALGRLVVRSYLDSYRRSREAVTQSLCDLSRAEALAKAVKALAEALVEALAIPGCRLAILDARDRVQSYDTRDNVDLGDLCRLLHQAKLPERARAAADAVAAAATGAGGYVLDSGYVGDPMARSTGASIYFPTQTVSPLYDRLDWAKKTGWAGFLRAYLAGRNG